MVKLRTYLSFGFSVERKRPPKESKTTKTPSKFFVVIKEIIQKCHLKS